MLIENPDAFKTWLTSILEPLCEADPAALAKYVYALVKKDKPLDDLRDGMVDQLDVFLQQETKPFVELLFKTLETQEYLSPAAPPPVAVAVATPAAPKPLLPEPIAEVPSSVLASAPAPVNNNNNVVSSKMSERLDERREGRRGSGGSKHRIVLNRTTKFTPATVPKEKPAYATEQTLVKVMPDLLEDSLNESLPPRNSRRDRKSDSDKEDRRRRAYRSRSPGGRSRSRSADRTRRPGGNAPGNGRTLWRNRSPPPQHPPPRYRRSRSGSPPPVRGPRYRNRSPPPWSSVGEPPQNRSRSRSRERQLASPPILRERIDRADRVSRERDRDRTRRDRSERNERRPRDPPSGAATPTQDSNPGDSGPIRGAATTLAGIFAPVPKKRCRDFDEKGYCMRGDQCPYDHGLDPVVLEDAALSRVLAIPIAGHPPPRPPVPAEYNPLAPDIWARSGGLFSGPPPPLHPPQLLQRELIPIQTVRVEEQRIAEVGATNLPLPPGPPPSYGAPPPPHAPHHPAKKKPFDFNRLSGPNRHHGNKGGAGGNCSLELKKVPRGLNDIMHLNNHFTKFGKIVNIQVSYEGDPEAAIVTFSSHTEANVAYKSTEAVLNNRFIKVFWHNTESKQENVPPGQRAPVKERLNPANTNNINHVSHNKVLINKDNLKITNTALAEAKQLAGQQKLEAAAAAIAAAPSNGDASPKPPVLVPAPAPEANHAKPHNDSAASQELAALVRRRDMGAAKIAKEIRRRSQHLLDKQLQDQKFLITRLEASTTPAQKEELLAMIKSNQESIEKTRKELVTQPKGAHANTHQWEETHNMVSCLSVMSISRKRPAGSLTNNNVAAPPAKKVPRSKEEAQKEILDAELDLFTRQQEGQDVSELQRRVAELRRQQHGLRPAPLPRRPLPQRPNIRAKFSKLTAMTNKTGLFVNQSVDHRPKSVLVSGYEADEQEQVVQHFSQFGTVVETVVDASTPSVCLQFRARKEAELAMAKGKQFNDRTLSVTWAQSPVRVSEPAVAVAAVAQEEQPSVQPPEETTVAEDIEFEGGAELSEDILLQDDEEEDEENEDRSWRR